MPAVPAPLALAPTLVSVGSARVKVRPYVANPTNVLARDAPPLVQFSTTSDWEGKARQ